MRVNKIAFKENAKNANLVVFSFMAFSGYYSALMLLNNLVVGSATRGLTIPLRMVIVFAIVWVFIFRPRMKLRRGLFYFLLFSSAYLLRILVEYADSDSSFHLTEAEFFLYFMSFVFIPMLLLGQSRLREDDYGRIFMSVMASTLLLSLLTVVFYGDVVGSAVRLSVLVKRGENYISPLALSYCGILGIGIGTAFLITNKVDGIKKLLIYSTIGSSFVPFYLGATRGSVFALAIPFLFYFSFAKGVKRKMAVLVSTAILIVLFLVATDYLGSGVFIRFFGIRENLEMGRIGRIELWKQSIMQFIEHPVFGNSLESDFRSAYPHNIIIEVLITTGIVGFVPFALLLTCIFHKMKWIVENKNKDFWICIVFLQAFTQNMFSGGIYAASWFAIGSGLVLGYGKSVSGHRERIKTYKPKCDECSPFSEKVRNPFRIAIQPRFSEGNFSTKGFRCYRL